MVHPLSANAIASIDSNVCPSTKRQYASRMRIFKVYCNKHSADPYTAHVNVILNFLTQVVKKRGLAYQTVCSYRSAVSRQHIGVRGYRLSNHPSFKRLIKGLFIEKPPCQGTQRSGTLKPSSGT